MASLAEKRVADDEATLADPQARPEELRLLEALLFASAEPIDQATLAKRMPDGVDIKAALAQLQAEYAPRGVNLVRVANKWTFRTAGDLSWLMTRESTETRRLSRAAIEVLSIIAYHQPVTRAEIEDIRGVITSKGTLDVLLETGWIRPRGRRKTPGRPLTFGPPKPSCRSSAWKRSATCRVSRNCAGRAFWIHGCRPVSAFQRRRMMRPCARTRIRWRTATAWRCCWRPPRSRKRATGTSSR